MRESRWRSVVKGMTWRVVASGATMMIVFVVTGDLALVAGVGLLDISIKTAFYYLHERLWGQVHWGIVGPEPRPPR